MIRTSKIILALVAITSGSLLAFNAVANDNNYVYAMHLFSKGRTKAGLSYLITAATKDRSVKAQAELLRLRDRDLIKDEFFEKNINVYETSAFESENPLAVYNLGFMLAHGIGVPMNGDLALDFYQQSAKEGNALAQYELGVAFEYGQNGLLQTDKNLILAREYYKKSAEQGNVIAQEGLNRILEKIQNKKVKLHDEFTSLLDKWVEVLGSLKKAESAENEDGVSLAEQKGALEKKLKNIETRVESKKKEIKAFSPDCPSCVASSCKQNPMSVDISGIVSEGVASVLNQYQKGRN